MINDISSSRFELKYRIHYQDYLKIRNALQIYMNRDKYTRAARGRGYLLRSLYYDTDDYASYHEKMDGNNQRIKLRIRSYSESPGDVILNVVKDLGSWVVGLWAGVGNIFIKNSLLTRINIRFR